MAPPNGKRVAVEVFAPIEEEGCRMPPPEIERGWYLKHLGYTYTVTAVRRPIKPVVRKRDLPRQVETVCSQQMMFVFAKERT